MKITQRNAQEIELETRPQKSPIRVGDLVRPDFSLPEKYKGLDLDEVVGYTSTGTTYILKARVKLPVAPLQAVEFAGREFVIERMTCESRGPAQEFSFVARNESGEGAGVHFYR